MSDNLLVNNNNKYYEILVPSKLNYKIFYLKNCVNLYYLFLYLEKCKYITIIIYLIFK